MNTKIFKKPSYGTAFLQSGHVSFLPSNLIVTLAMFLLIQVTPFSCAFFQQEFISITWKVDESILVDSSTDFSSIVKINGLARAFNVSYPNYDWCTPDYKHTHPTGLLYVKNPKAASTTTAGVAHRIARRVPLAHDKGTTACTAKVNHIPNYHVGPTFGGRDKERSFLFSTVRDPAKRAISRIFFSDVSWHGNKPTDENVLKWLNNTDSQKGSISPGMGGFQLPYLSLSRIEAYSAWSPDQAMPVDSLGNMVINPSAVHENVRRVIDQYDFLIIVERFDESLVAMQLLLDLSVTDFLYLSSKHTGDYWMNGGCIYLHKAFVSAAVEDYLTSPLWYAQNYGDYLLLEAASQSLDLTIEQLGVERFRKALDEFLSLRDKAEQKCDGKAVFPCTAEGIPQGELAKSHCYSKDQGCGYPCLDEFSRNLVEPSSE